MSTCKNLYIKTSIRSCKISSVSSIVLQSRASLQKLAETQKLGNQAQSMKKKERKQQEEDKCKTKNVPRKEINSYRASKNPESTPGINEKPQHHP
jgi:hypothetical protein